MATRKTTPATEPEPPDDGKCANCGACKECGAGGMKFVPYPMPYPVYPQPRPYYPPQGPWITGPRWTTQPTIWGGTNAAGITATATWQSNAGGNYTL